MSTVQSTTKQVDSSSSPNLAGGFYDVTENGVQFCHVPPLPTPKDGKEFLKRFSDGFKLNVLERPNPNELVFEIIGIDVSFANALRRIMIAEVPTVAIEHVYMWNNSSIVHDEVLAHRIGLVPINCDPRVFEDILGDDDEPTDRNTIVFRLEAKCGNNKEEDAKRDRIRKNNQSNNNNDANTNSKDESVLGQEELDTIAAESAAYHQQTQNASQTSQLQEAIEAPDHPYTRHVYSKDLEWVPEGDQVDRFPISEDGSGGIRPVHEDILLAKLRPGQVIELEAHGRRGVGKDHAKYSPVATASYRLMPKVELIRPVYGELAEKLVNLYEPGVFRLENCNYPEEKTEGDHGRYSRTVKAVVHNPYACTMSRNYMREPKLKESLRITRMANHFIFSIESVGMLPPGVILTESLKILQEKCRNLIRMLDESLEVEGLND